MWKDTDMPQESERQQDLMALKEDLGDVLEWEQAQYTTNEAIIYT